MNDWHDIDNLQFEMKGMTRNALFGTAFIAFCLYLIVDFLSKPYLEDAPKVMGLMPLVGVGLFWWFFMIPQVRRFNETHPKGYMKGIIDYYLFNPRTLEITTDDEPMPTYIPDRTPR